MIKIPPVDQITRVQLEGWACIQCGVSAGPDVPMKPVGNVRVDGQSWTLFAHKQPCPAVDEPVTVRIPPPPADMAALGLGKPQDRPRLEQDEQPPATLATRLAFMTSMTETELRHALAYIAGYAPQAFDSAAAAIRRDRQVDADPAELDVEASGAAEPAPYIPQRGDAVEAWLTARRDVIDLRGTPLWDMFHALLTDYRAHADARLPLDQKVECWCEHVDIGVGYQKVDENPDCPKCIPPGERP